MEITNKDTESLTKMWVELPFTPTTKPIEIPLLHFLPHVGDIMWIEDFKDGEMFRLSQEKAIKFGPLRVGEIRHYVSEKGAHQRTRNIVIKLTWDQKSPMKKSNE
jgi:hypothetical protein